MATDNPQSYFQEQHLPTRVVVTYPDTHHDRNGALCFPLAALKGLSEELIMGRHGEQNPSAATL
jgi:hypothetical protein